MVETLNVHDGNLKIYSKGTHCKLNLY